MPLSSMPTRSSEMSALLDPAALIASTEAAFCSVFAILARTHLFSDLQSSQQVDGTIAYSQSRLATVSWSVYTSIVIIAILVVLTVLLAIVVHQQPPILSEEPQGILSAAVLMYRCDLQELIADPEWQHRHGGEFQKWLKERYKLGEEHCTLDEDGVVRLNGLMEKQG